MFQIVEQLFNNKASAAKEQPQRDQERESRIGPSVPGGRAETRSANRDVGGTGIEPATKRV
jgi:hypothetical protein